MMRLCIAVLVLLFSKQALALNILLTNDDGFETANIQALYKALSEAGHNVLMVAPFTGQSGTGGQLQIMQPLGPTKEASEDGLLPAGSAGVGSTTLGKQQFYVNSTPAVSVLYGIDVLASKVFAGRPDLVISGPNEGNNLGVLTPHSGTLGATVAALNKGLPAVAVSAANGDPEAAVVVANLVVKLVAAVTDNGVIKLPKGVGLNVNTPEIGELNAQGFVFAFTQVGSSSNVGLHAFENLGDSSFAQQVGMPKEIGLPGLAVSIPPESAGYAADGSANSESNRLAPGVVTVSPIRGTYAASEMQSDGARDALSKLLNTGK